MLPLLLSSSLGFGSFGGSDDLGPCVDTPDAEMKMSVGMACTEIKAEGKCESVHTSLLEKEARAAGIGALGRRELSTMPLSESCPAACGLCVPEKMTYNGAGGIGALGRRELSD